ncbi:MAG: hypothetical protein HOC71_19095 [Candidatus Latescibacteria bacterium]|jgi:hypothetical protein|nr:hypothetical protein [Candidatus Latescibacterota bacterium]
MSQNDSITIQKDTIDFDNIEALVDFTRYRSHDQQFVEGLELTEDLQTKSGITLYTKDTVITPKHVARLIEFQVSQPTINLTFKIKKNASLINKFRKEIQKDFENIVRMRMKNKVYRDLFFDIKDDLERIIEEFLADDEITLSVYTMKFLCECSKIKRSMLFYIHSLSVALFAVAFGLSKQYDEIIEGSREKLITLCKVGIFHSYGAINNIDNILKAEEEKRLEMYQEDNRNGYSLLSKIQLDYEILDSIRILCDYFMGRREFITQDDINSMMPNIVLVTESFLRIESGLFAAPREPRDVVDQLNIDVTNNKYNKLAVQALTLGLNLNDIFDFYKELDFLKTQCIYNDSAVPYPLDGFMSPTLFVCKNAVTKCKYLEGSLKAATLAKQLGELKPGRYHRCWLLTPKLIAFYKGHYKDIKKTSREEDKVDK